MGHFFGKKILKNKYTKRVPFFHFLISKPKNKKTKKKVWSVNSALIKHIMTNHSSNRLIIFLKLNSLNLWVRACFTCKNLFLRWLWNYFKFLIRRLLTLCANNWAYCCNFKKKLHNLSKLHQIAHFDINSRYISIADICNRWQMIKHSTSSIPIGLAKKGEKSRGQNQTREDPSGTPCLHILTRCTAHCVARVSLWVHIRKHERLCGNI